MQARPCDGNDCKGCLCQNCKSNCQDLAEDSSSSKTGTPQRRSPRLHFLGLEAIHSEDCTKAKVPIISLTSLGSVGCRSSRLTDVRDPTQSYRSSSLHTYIIPWKTSFANAACYLKSTNHCSRMSFFVLKECKVYTSFLVLRASECVNLWHVRFPD